MWDTVQTLWDAFWDIPHIRLYLTFAWTAYLIPLCIWILLQKREPVATLSWLMALAALPYIGYAVFFFFGPQKISRQKLRRINSLTKLDAKALAGPLDDECTELALLSQKATGLRPSTAADVRLLIDGAATYKAILEAVSQAKNHIHIEYYIYMPDNIGTRLRDALIERAHAGVKVRLLLDAVGSGKVKRKFIEPLKAAGVELAWFHKSHIRLAARSWINLRTHRKIVVVDGEIAFTGGINITDEEDESLRDDAYRDLHLRLEGDVVRSVQVVFIEDWIYATGQDRSVFEKNNLWRPSPAPGIETISAHVVVSGPDSLWEAIHRVHVAAIHEAKQRVWLVTPYFVPGEAARMALTSAALGGLDTRLLVPKQSDSKLVTYAARSYFDELLAAGVKIYEYGPRMLHTKAMLCDDNLALIGSANFDQRSFRLNFEIQVLIRDRGVVKELETLLLGEFAASEVVNRDSKRPLWTSRLPEAAARLMSPLL